MRPLLRELLSYLGSSFIISVACMDPGSWAINTSGGAKFGLVLPWVIVLVSAIAVGTQVLAVKLGTTTGKGATQLCRERSSGSAVVLLWAVAELAVIVADMAEVIGAAIGFSLAFSLPLWVGSVLMAVSSLAPLGVRTAYKRGFRWAELIIMSLVSVIALAFVFEMALARPTVPTVAFGLVPTVPNASTLYVAIGILGATMMSHSVYLHPYIVQDRRDRLIESDGDIEAAHRHHFRLERLDTIVAFFGAMFVNAAMLIIAATVLQGMGIETLEEVYVILSGVFGADASLAFGVALIAAGFSLPPVATMVDQTAMDGFLDLDINVWLRRSVTPVPSLLIVAVGFNSTSVLVASQVVLSFELPFVLIPPLRFTHEALLTENFRNRATTTGVLGVAIAVIVALNGWFLYSMLLGRPGGGGGGRTSN